jgi:hypothetical protein
MTRAQALEAGNYSAPGSMAEIATKIRAAYEPDAKYQD